MQTDAALHYQQREAERQRTNRWRYEDQLLQSCDLRTNVSCALPDLARAQHIVDYWGRAPQHCRDRVDSMTDRAVLQALQKEAAAKEAAAQPALPVSVQSANRLAYAV